MTKENSKKSVIGESIQTTSYPQTVLAKSKIISETQSKTLRKKLTLLEMNLKYPDPDKRSLKRLKIRSNSYYLLTSACNRSSCWVKTKAMNRSLQRSILRKYSIRRLTLLKVSKRALESPLTTWQNLRHQSSRITLNPINHGTTTISITVKLVPALLITETRNHYSERQIDLNLAMVLKEPLLVQMFQIARKKERNWTVITTRP